MTQIDRRSLLGAGAVALGALAIPAVWGVTAAAAAPATPRVVDIDGALNVRDLGGYRAVGGRTVRFGVGIRSGSLSTVTDKGLGQLAALRLHTVIDYRQQIEIGSQGPDRVPAGVRLVNLPVENQLPGGGAQIEPRVAPGAPPSSPDPIVEQNFRSYVTNPASRASFAAGLRLCADRSAVPLLFNDSAGAGRTGWAAAVLLAALGVSKADIYRDYLYTNTALGGTYVFREYLDAGIDQAVTSYGSVVNYYTRGLGVTAAELKQIWANFLA